MRSLSFLSALCCICFSISAAAQASLADVCNEVIKSELLTTASKEYCSDYLEKVRESNKAKEEKEQLLMEIRRSLQVDRVISVDRSAILPETLKCTQKTKTVYSCSVDVGPKFLCQMGDRGDAGVELVNNEILFQADNLGGIIPGTARRLSNCPD